MKSGIYCITNRRNGKVYIGSAVQLRKRKNQHFCLLRTGRHPNRHLQAAYQQDGPANFGFAVLELTTARNLRRRERYWLMRTVAYDNRYGYNKSKDTDAPRGYRLSLEIRQAQSQQRRGKPWTANRREAHIPGRTWTMPKQAVCRSRAAKLLQYLVLAPDEQRHVVQDLKAFCREHRLGYPNMSGLSRGWGTHYKGWRCYRLQPGASDAQAIANVAALQQHRLTQMRQRALQYFRDHAEACRARNRKYCKTRRKVHNAVPA